MIKMKEIFLGIDIGGTNIFIALIDNKGRIYEEARFPTDVKKIPGKIISQILRETVKIFYSTDIDRLRGIGIGCAGQINQKKGVVEFSPNLFWKNVNIVDRIRKGLGNINKKFFKIPIVLDNDANAAAWGAYIVELKRKVNNLMCITLGTGIGGGFVLDGKLYHGASGKAGEVGHINLYPDGLRCNCGNRGCIERYIGSEYIVERMKEGIKKGKGKKLLRLVNGNIELLTPKILQIGAEQHDSFSISLWNEIAKELGIILGGIINLLNPEVIIFTGGISRTGDILFEPLKKAIKENCFSYAFSDVKLLVSKLKDKLGVIGSALLPLSIIDLSGQRKEDR